MWILIFPLTLLLCSISIRGGDTNPTFLHALFPPSALFFFGSLFFLPAHHPKKPSFVLLPLYAPVSRPLVSFKIIIYLPLPHQSTPFTLFLICFILLLSPHSSLSFQLPQFWGHRPPHSQTSNFNLVGIPHAPPFSMHLVIFWFTLLSPFLLPPKKKKTNSLLLPLQALDLATPLGHLLFLKLLFISPLPHRSTPLTHLSIF